MVNHYTELNCVRIYPFLFGILDMGIREKFNLGKGLQKYSELLPG
jgi:hypothetical protein